MPTQTMVIALDPTSRRRLATANGYPQLMSKLDDAGIDWRAVDYDERTLSRSLAEHRAARALAAESRPPAGYRLRRLPPLAASTLRRPLQGAWIYALREIADAGGWTTWGSGHEDAPVQNALAYRGLIWVAEPTRRGRLLFKVTPLGRSTLTGPSTRTEGSHGA